LYRKSRNLLGHILQNVDRGPQIRPTQNFWRGAPYARNLDFANSVLIGTSSSNIYKLQRVENCLAKVVLQDFSNSVTCLLSQLHWLLVSKRIQFEIASCNAYVPVSYLRSAHLSFFCILILYQPQRSLRSVSVRTCYSYHAATAVLNKEVFPIVPLKSGMSCHFRPDSLLHFIHSSATWKLTILQITDHLATASSASDSALLTYSALYITHSHGSARVF